MKTQTRSTRLRLASVTAFAPAVVAVAMTLPACSNENTVLDPVPNLDPPKTAVVMVDDIQQVAAVGRYNVEAARIRKDTGKLEIDVTVSGGCKEHDYTLYVSRAFRESVPLQTDAYLVHYGNGDLCEALIYETVSFDLGPLDQELPGDSPGGDIGIYLWIANDETRTTNRSVLYGGP